VIGEYKGASAALSSMGKSRGQQRRRYAGSAIFPGHLNLVDEELRGLDGQSIDPMRVKEADDAIGMFSDQQQIRRVGENRFEVMIGKRCGMKSVHQVACHTDVTRSKRANRGVHRSKGLTLKVTGAPTRCAPKIKPRAGASG